MEVSIGVQMFAVFSLRRWVWGWAAHGSIAISATAKAEALQVTVWFLVGNGGMDYGDYYGGIYRDYYRDPFRHSLLGTRQVKVDVRGDP